MSKVNKLEDSYRNICTKYINKFCKKQELEFDGWIGNTVGEIAYISNFYFNFSDILLDIDTNQPKGLIIDWYYDSLDFEHETINYKSYTMGLRFNQLNTIKLSVKDYAILKGKSESSVYSDIQNDRLTYEMKGNKYVILFHSSSPIKNNQYHEMRIFAESKGYSDLYDAFKSLGIETFVLDYKNKL